MVVLFQDNNETDRPRIALRAILPRTDTSSGHASGACRKGIKGLFRHPTSASAPPATIFGYFHDLERLVALRYIQHQLLFLIERLMNFWWSRAREAIAA